jgi:hypothetical protein
MLNYRSVTNSEPQIRSNPALRHCPTAFQKNVETLLQDINPPFPTYARVLPKHGQILSRHLFHTWIKPAHLRSQWIVISDNMPVILMDCKNTKHSSKIRIPARKLRLQEVGTILLEGAWDAQEHTLWIWDVLYWDRNLIWNSEPYSKRWDILKEITDEILDVGNPMSDATIQLPSFETLQEIRKRIVIDSAFSVEFQPEAKGQRRLCFFQPRKLQVISKPPVQLKPQVALKPHVSLKPQVIQEPVFMIDEEDMKETKEIKKENPKKIQSARLVKDKTSKLPDTYRVLLNDDDMGLLTIRSIDMSKKLRELFQTREFCVADVEWYEPFQKYELKQLYVSPP